MPRIKLIEQESYEFSHTILVRVSDLNVANHVGNEQMAALIHEARRLLLRDLGLSEANLGDGKSSVIIGDMGINFMAEAYADDQLLIESRVGEIGDKGFRIFHRIGKNDTVVALAETGIIAYSYFERKISRVPDEFKAALEQFRLALDAKETNALS